MPRLFSGAILAPVGRDPFVGVGGEAGALVVAADIGDGVVQVVEVEDKDGELAGGPEGFGWGEATLTAIGEDSHGGAALEAGDDGVDRLVEGSEDQMSMRRLNGGGEDDVSALARGVAE